MTARMLETSHGKISVKESSGQGLPVLMIHGNSSCNAVFRNQFESGIGNTFRLIAPDLPGHGKSEDARNPERSYSMPGYADCMTEVLSVMGVSRAAIFGWSLGGHIGLEMLSRFPGVAGLMITGTPPVVAADAFKGFKASPHMNLAGKEHFTETDIDAYARNTCGEPYDPVLWEAVARTDGRARLLMLGKFLKDEGANQAEVVKGKTPPIAVVNGADEPFVNVDYLDTIPFSNLWEGRTIKLEKSGHAPFWDSPDRFNPILVRFITSLT
jgi:pimeloyl-ACP methyl ester carboxylesterase